MKIYIIVAAASIIGLIAGRFIPERKTVTNTVTVISEKEQCDKVNGDFLAYNFHDYEKNKESLRVKCTSNNEVFNYEY